MTAALRRTALALAGCFVAVLISVASPAPESAETPSACSADGVSGSEDRGECQQQRLDDESLSLEEGEGEDELVTLQLSVGSVRAMQEQEAVEVQVKQLGAELAATEEEAIVDAIKYTVRGVVAGMNASHSKDGLASVDEAITSAAADAAARPKLVALGHHEPPPALVAAQAASLLAAESDLADADAKLHHGANELKRALAGPGGGSIHGERRALVDRSSFILPIVSLVIVLGVLLCVKGEVNKRREAKHEPLITVDKFITVTSKTLGAADDALAVPNGPAEAATTQGSPSICPTFVLPFCEVRFAVAMPKLMEAIAEGTGRFDIIGFSGNPLFHASLRLQRTADGLLGGCVLEIFLARRGSKPCATVMPHLTGGIGVLEISGPDGVAFGTLTPQGAKAYLVAKYVDGTSGLKLEPVMAINGDPSKFEVVVNSPADGAELAAVSRNNEWLDDVEHAVFRVNPGVDAVLALSSVLASALQVLASGLPDVEDTTRAVRAA